MARKREYFKISINDNIISDFNSDDCKFTTLNNATHFPKSPFTFNRSTIQLPTITSNFQGIAHSFRTILVMANLDDETFS